MYLTGGMDKWIPNQLRLFTLIWKLVLVYLRHGNLPVFYHICGSIGAECKDTPMEVEGVEIRETGLGPKVTIW